MSAVACPICGTNAQNHTVAGYDGLELDCRRCGKYSITNSALSEWTNIRPNSKQITNACGWIRDHQKGTISSYEISALLSAHAPSIAERANKILIQIASFSYDLSYKFDINSNDILDSWLGISYSSNTAEIDYLFRIYLKEETGYLIFNALLEYGGGFSFVDIQISPKGYAYLETLSRANPSSQIGFCAMWFSNEVKPIWTDAIEPAIKQAGYDPKRIDNHQHNNRIDDEIIAMLRRSKFVVADFTGQRGGVYFESGFALG